MIASEKQIEQAAGELYRFQNLESAACRGAFKKGAEWARSQMLSEIIEIAGNAFDAAREMDYIDGGKVFDYVHPDKESYLKTIKEKLK